jgi:GNAT superfamily N-acetyltransferase
MKNFLNAITRFLLGLRRPSKPTNARLLRQRGETPQGLLIRDATLQDVPPLAELHVKTWSDTYWPIINPPTYQIRERQWREQFDKSDGSWFCLVVETRVGTLVGFAKGRAYASDELPGYAGELNKIYLLREYQRLGIGRRLVGHVARRFLDQGITTMVLFGTPQNPSCAFHEALGGERLYARNGEFHGGYGWRDLRKLASICPIEPSQHERS